jgi:hypothetical protein
MKATGESLFVQPRTRIPEGIVEIPIDDVLRVTPDTQSGSNLGRAIGAGAAAGAGATLAIFLILMPLLETDSPRFWLRPASCTPEPGSGPDPCCTRALSVEVRG